MPSTSYAGQVGGYTKRVSVTLSLDTNAYADGDVIATTQVVTDALRVVNGTGVLQSIAVYDNDDQTAYGFDINIHRTSTTLGTENAAISISDANLVAAQIETVTFAAADAVDFINGRAYFKRNIGLPVQAADGTADLYISMVSRGGTPTHSASGITVVLGILQD